MCLCDGKEQEFYQREKSHSRAVVDVFSMREDEAEQWRLQGWDSYGDGLCRLSVLPCDHVRFNGNTGMTTFLRSRSTTFARAGAAVGGGGVRRGGGAGTLFSWTISTLGPKLAYMHRFQVARVIFGESRSS